MPSAPQKPKPKKPAPAWRPTYLRAYREWKGWSVEKMAAEMQYNSGTLNEIENGKKRYNQDVLEKAAVALDVPPSFLIGRPPPPKGVDIDRSDPQYVAWKIDGMTPRQRGEFSQIAGSLIAKH